MRFHFRIGMLRIIWKLLNYCVDCPGPHKDLDLQLLPSFRTTLMLPSTQLRCLFAEARTRTLCFGALVRLWTRARSIPQRPAPATFLKIGRQSIVFNGLDLDSNLIQVLIPTYITLRSEINVALRLLILGLFSRGYVY